MNFKVIWLIKIWHKIFFLKFNSGKELKIIVSINASIFDVAVRSFIQFVTTVFSSLVLVFSKMCNHRIFPLKRLVESISKFPSVDLCSRISPYYLFSDFVFSSSFLFPFHSLVRLIAIMSFILIIK